MTYSYQGVEKQVEWRTIPGFPRYEISEEGHVRNIKTQHLFYQRVTSKNPRRVNLTGPDGLQHIMATHRIVAAVFHPDYIPNREIDFLDGDSNNCHWSNLHISTRRKWTKGIF